MPQRRSSAETLHLIAIPSRQRPRVAAEEDAVHLNVHRDEPLLLTVEQAADRLGIGRSLLYELLAAGDIDSVHVGRLRRIPVEALTAYVNALRTRQPRTAS